MMQKIVPSFVMLILGLLGGLLVSRSVRREPPAPSRREEAPPSRSQAPSDETSLKRRIEEQRVEIQRLREQAAALPKTAARTPPKDPRTRALEIAELFRRGARGWFSRDQIRALGSLDELTEEMTSVFAEQFDLAKDDEIRNTLLLLVLLAGGPDATKFVVSKLQDPQTSPRDREALLSNLGGMGSIMDRKLPLDASVDPLIQTLLVSTKPNERSAAAGLLGGSATDDTRARLKTMAQTDPDMNVRASAIDSLGYVGDRSVMEYLQSYPRPENQWAVNNALDRALMRLKERFPQ